MRIYLYSIILTLITSMLGACGSSGGGSAPVDTTISLSASELTILPGDVAELTPVFPATSTAIIDNGVGPVDSNTPVSVTPSSTTTYTLSVTHSDGEIATASVTVTVLALASLEIVDANLDQVFQPQLYAYTASTGYLARSARVRATTDIPDALITVNSVAVDVQGYSQLVTLTEDNTTNFNVVITLGDVSNTYTISISRSNLTTLAQQAYIKASNTGDNDEFGYSVALSGDTLVVGAYLEDADDSGSFDNSGAVYVFIRNGNTWEHQAYLKASNAQADDYFGASVGISGDTIVVGALYEDSATTGANSTPNEDALQAGAAYVFTRSGGTWSQQAYLKASNTQSNDNFGHSVAIHSDTIVVGAIGEDSSVPGVNQTPDEGAPVSGAVYVFVRDENNNWSQQAYIKSSNPGSLDRFGYSVSVYGDTIAVGAEEEDSITTGINTTPDDPSVNENSGAAYVFVRNGTSWSQQAYIKASNNASNNRFGHSISVNGDSLVVGAPFESTTQSASGAAYVYTRSGETWSEQQFIKASNIGKTDRFGISVALSSDTLAIGADQEDSDSTSINDPVLNDPNTNENRGAVYTYTRTADTWTEKAYIKASNSGSDDLFGSSVALSGDTVTVGAIWEDGSTTTIDGPDDDASTNSGAVYVYE